MVDTKSLKISGSGDGNAKTSAVVKKHITNMTAAAVQQEFAKKILVAKKIEGGNTCCQSRMPPQDETKMTNDKKVDVPRKESSWNSKQGCPEKEIRPITLLKDDASKGEETKWLETTCNHPDTVREAIAHMSSISRPRIQIKKDTYRRIRRVNDQDLRGAYIVEGKTLPNPNPSGQEKSPWGFVWVQYDSEPHFAYLTLNFKLEFPRPQGKPVRSTRGKIDRFGPSSLQQPKMSSLPVIDKHAYISNPTRIPSLAITEIRSRANIRAIRLNPIAAANDFNFEITDDLHRCCHYHDEFIYDEEASGIDTAAIVDAINAYHCTGRKRAPFVDINPGERKVQACLSTNSDSFGPENAFVQPKGSRICVVASISCLLSARGLDDLAHEIFKRGCAIPRDGKHQEKLLKVVRKLLQPVGFRFRELEELLDPLDPGYPCRLSLVCEASQVNEQRSGHMFAINNGFVHDPAVQNVEPISRTFLDEICAPSKYAGMSKQYCLESPTVFEGPQCMTPSNFLNIVAEALVPWGKDLASDDVLSCSKIFYTMATAGNHPADASSQLFATTAGPVLNKAGIRVERAKQDGGPFFSPLKINHLFRTPVLGKPIPPNPNHVMPFLAFYKNQMNSGNGDGWVPISDKALNDFCAPNSFLGMDFSYCVHLGLVDEESCSKRKSNSQQEEQPKKKKSRGKRGSGSSKKKQSASQPQANSCGPVEANQVLPPPKPSHPATSQASM